MTVDTPTGDWEPTGVPYWDPRYLHTTATKDEILTLIVDGTQTTKQIAARLNIPLHPTLGRNRQLSTLLRALLGADYTYWEFADREHYHKPTEAGRARAALVRAGHTHTTERSNA